MEVNEEEDFKKESSGRSTTKEWSSWTRNKKSIDESGNQEVTTRCANSFPKVIE